MLNVDNIISVRGALVVVITIGLAAVAAGVGTSALFTDQEQTTSSVSAGTLDLTVEESGSISVSIENATPGDTGSTQGSISNAGTLAGTISQINISVNSSEDNIDTEPEEAVDDTSDGDLDEYLTLTIYVDDDGDLSTSNDQTTVATGNLSTIQQNSPHEISHPIEGGASSNIVVEWSLPSDTGNIVQGDLLSFDLEIELEQTT